MMGDEKRCLREKAYIFGVTDSPDASTDLPELEEEGGSEEFVFNINSQVFELNGITYFDVIELTRTLISSCILTKHV